MTDPFYRPETYQARSAICYLIRRSHNLVTPKLEALFADHGFTFTQWAVLMHLRDGLADTAADIARRFGHDSGAMTRILDQLETRGFVEKQRCNKDRRVVRLSLTNEGRQAIEALLPPVVDFQNDLIDGFSRQEAETLIRLMTKLIDRLETMDEPAAHKSEAEERRVP